MGGTQILGGGMTTWGWGPKMPRGGGVNPWGDPITMRGDPKSHRDPKILVGGRGGEGETHGGT